jgi:hypothetical protein
LWAVRWPFLSKREQSDVARRERVEEVEKNVTRSLRALATAFSKLADAVEKRRLARAGYEKPEQFLERTDGTKE